MRKMISTTGVILALVCLLLTACSDGSNGGSSVVKHEPYRKADGSLINGGPFTGTGNGHNTLSVTLEFDRGVISKVDLDLSRETAMYIRRFPDLAEAWILEHNDAAFDILAGASETARGVRNAVHNILSDQQAVNIGWRKVRIARPRVFEEID